MASKLKKSEPKRTAKKRASKKAPVLLSEGNLQIAKADGDAPVQEYIAAMPGWKRELDEAQTTRWRQQAAALAGWEP